MIEVTVAFKKISNISIYCIAFIFRNGCSFMPTIESAKQTQCNETVIKRISEEIDLPISYSIISIKSQNKFCETVITTGSENYYTFYSNKDTVIKGDMFKNKIPSSKEPIKEFQKKKRHLC